MMTRLLRSLGLVVVALAFVVTPADSANHEQFFQGKTIRIIVGATPGGGFDTYSRAIARHMGKHIPGNPTVIVENMAGAGTLIAANHVYKVAKPDGLTIGNFIAGLVLGQLLGQPGIEFEARRFEWVGVPSNDSVACVFTKASGITSLERWMSARTPPKLGGVAVGSTSPDNAIRLLKTVLGLPLQLVAGYKGTAEIRLAAEGGELAGSCWEWESIKVTWRKALDSGDVVVVLQLAASPLPDLPGIPMATALAKSAEARKLLQVAALDQSAITRLYALPPATPQDRVQLLRKAFMATMRDPEFLSDATKSKLAIQPTSGEEVREKVRSLFTLEPTMVAKLKEILLGR